MIKIIGMFKTILMILCKKLKINMLNIAMGLIKRYKVLFILMLATGSIVAICVITLMAIIIMDVSVKLLLNAEIINYELAAMGGIIFILGIPALIVWGVFNLKPDGQWLFRKGILDHAEHYKCSFNIIFFLVALVLLKDQYWPIEGASRVFFQNQSFWGIPLITFFFRVMLDYYLLEEKESSNIE